jgi:hypothetical protein
MKLIGTLFACLFLIVMVSASSAAFAFVLLSMGATRWKEGRAVRRRDVQFEAVLLLMAGGAMSLVAMWLTHSVVEVVWHATGFEHLLWYPGKF